MVEAGASEITEQEMLEAIFFGHEEIQRLVDFQQQIVDHIQPVKQEFIPTERDEALVERKIFNRRKGLKETVLTFDKQQRDENLDNLKEEIVNEFIDEEDPENELLIKEVYAILNELVKEEVRRLIADEKLDQTAVNLMKSVH